MIKVGKLDEKNLDLTKFKINFFGSLQEVTIRDVFW